MSPDKISAFRYKAQLYIVVGNAVLFTDNAFFPCICGNRHFFLINLRESLEWVTQYHQQSGGIKVSYENKTFQ